MGSGVAVSLGTLSRPGGLPPHLGAQRLAWQHLGGKRVGLDGQSCRNPHMTLAYWAAGARQCRRALCAVAPQARWSRAEGDFSRSRPHRRREARAHRAEARVVAARTVEQHGVHGKAERAEAVAGEEG